MTPYAQSVVNQLQRWQSVNYMGTRLPRWMPRWLVSLEKKMPTAHPLELLALTGLRWEQDDMQYTMRLDLRMLVQMGYGPAASVAMYSAFRAIHPTLPVPAETFPVLTRNQLCEMFGPGFGNMIADICVDPARQPCFAKLLLGGDVFQPVEMHAALSCVTATFNQMMLNDHKDSDEPPSGMQIPLELFSLVSGSSPQKGPLVPLPPHEAQQLYRDATGQEYPRFYSLHPLDVDYGSHHPEEEVRQADGPA